MAQEWYYTVNGEQVGPVSPAELKKAAKDGTLKQSDLVWKEGMSEWVEAQSIKGLFSATAAKNPEATKPVNRNAEGSEKEEEQPRNTIRKSKPSDDEDNENDDADDDDRPKRAIRKSQQEYDDYDDDDRPRQRSSGRGRRLPGFNRDEVRSKKITAAILAFLLGGYGVHKFYLGKTVPGILHILLCFGGFGIISLIEFIIYLTKSEEDFYKDYIIGDKGWF